MNETVPGTLVHMRTLRRFGLETSVRPSLALYNTKDDVDALVRSVRHLQSAREHRNH